MALRFSALPLLLLVLLGAPAPAGAWWDTGHMLTAAIAQQRLSPAAAAEADALIAASASAQADSPVPSLSVVSAAHWADDLKRRDWPRGSKMMRSPGGLFVDMGSAHLRSMHYIDYPLGPCNPTVLDRRNNLLVALRSHRRTLADRSAEPWTRGIALRFLLHMVGDLHQPLHAVARCTPLTPDGDAGGNDFKLLPGSAGDIDNLHSMWDSMGGAYIDTIEALAGGVRASNGTRSPGSSEAQREGLMLQEATRLVGAFASAVAPSFRPEQDGAPPGAGKAGPDAFEAWAMESNELARRVAYADIVENEEPSSNYVLRTRAETKRRVVLGGLRLAVVLNSVLGQPDEEPAPAPLGLATTVAATVGLGAGCGACWLVQRRAERQQRQAVRLRSPVKDSYGGEDLELLGDQRT